MKIISIVGYKKSGKTSLVEKLIPALCKYGKVGTIKHIHEDTLNPANTDTHRHIAAGAQVTVAITPSEQVKLVPEVNLQKALDELCDSGVDFAVVEGFKDSKLAKISIGITAENTARYIDPEQEFDEALIAELVELTLQQKDYHTLTSLIHTVKSKPEIKYAGAIGTFTGIVREVTGEVVTEGLEFEQYEGIAEEKMENICNDLKKRDGIVDVVMYHKTGWIAPAEDIVYIVVAAGHRHQMFPVLQEAIERLKEEVPIWKKEHTNEREYWVGSEI
jgi:molybdopterin synthase catalytic subunit